MVKYAIMKERVYAFFIDLIFVAGLGFIITLLLSLINVAFKIFDYSFFKSGYCIIASIILVWLYFALMESSKKQATFGKSLMGIKVTDLKYRRISFWKASKRFFLKILSFGITLNSKGQALHDKLSGCYTIKE
jgi:uncharacterized RDD family membrane protein YckC